jgi:hypothetical protein
MTAMELVIPFLLVLLIAILAQAFGADSRDLSPNGSLAA